MLSSYSPLPFTPVQVCRGVPLVRGPAGEYARRLIENCENPFIITQDESGKYKPRFHEFKPVR